MTLWNPVLYARKQILNNLGDGINNASPSFDIKDSQVSDAINMGSQNYPAIATRYGRTLYSTSMTTLATPYILGERGNSVLHVVDGNTWKYWDTATTAFVNLTTTLTGTYGDIQDFAVGTARYTMLMNSTQKLIWDGTSTATVLGDASTPFTDIFTSHRGRVFAGKNTTLYFSALNLPNDWTTPDDSGSINLTRSKGNITAITEYNDHVIIFTEYGMHELYGDSPTNYTLVDVEGDIGCISNRSIIKCNGRLYWMAKDGVYEYDGSSPRKISTNVSQYINGINYTYKSLAVSGSNDDIIYFGLPYGSTSNNIILTYDTINKVWYTETGNIIDFITIQSKLYALDSTGGINNMRDITATKDNGTEITWSFITKAYNDDTVSQKKTLSDVNLWYKCSTSASINVSYSTDDSSTSFTSLATSTDFDLTNKTNNERLIIPSTDLQNVDFYRLKFSGSGSAIFNRLERDYRIKRR